MSNSNCCFLTCIQVSQEEDQVVWYSHLFQNFPQFIVIHTVQGFGIVNKAEIDFFSGTLLLFDDPVDVGNLISGSSAFLNPAWTSGITWFTYCWSLAWRILSIPLLVCSHRISNFLEEICSLSHSVVFLYFFALITEEGFLISPCYSLELYIQMGISFFFSFAFCFSSFLSYL